MFEGIHRLPVHCQKSVPYKPSWLANDEFPPVGVDLSGSLAEDGRNVQRQQQGALPCGPLVEVNPVHQGEHGDSKRFK